ncbi:MAG: EAL domain-containing protein [Vallitaleaceae bacterium]|nr:EAL domain-containing protein [Vallitaleaceae bacterium]
MKLNSIKHILTTLIIVLGIVITFMFSLLSYKNTKDNLVQKYDDEAILILENTKQYFNKEFNRAEKVLDNLGNSQEFHEAYLLNEYSHLPSLFKIANATMSDSRAIHLGLPDGRIFSSETTPKDFTDHYDVAVQDWFVAAQKAKGSIIWTEPYFDYMKQDIIVTVAKQLTNYQDNMKPVLAIDFEVDTMSKVVTGLKVGSDGYVLLINRSGTIIANTDHYMIGEQFFKDVLSYDAKANQTYQMNYIINHQPYHLFYEKLDTSGMLLVTAVSQLEIKRNLFKAYLPILIIGVFCLLILSTFTYLLALRAIVPLEKLVTLMKSAKDGDYHVHSNIMGYYEIDTLSNSFNSMIKSIRTRDEHLQTINQSLTIKESELTNKNAILEQSELRLRNSRERIKQLAYYDVLTGLSNRQKLLMDFERILDSEQPSVKNGAILYLDLDNFKTINDTMGHTAGDYVLIEISKRLLQTIEVENSISRIGGDEFIVLLPNVTSEVSITDVASSILEIFKDPVVVEHKNFVLTASIGIALFPLNGVTVEDLLKKADTAMYAAKENGKNRFHFFDEKMQMQIFEKLNMEKAIRLALENNEFEVYYQPQYCVNDGSIYGMEALLRLNSSFLGCSVPPMTIIKTAENIGLISDIERMVFKKACEFGYKINQNCLNPILISVNVSIVHLIQDNFVQNIIEIIQQEKIDPYLIGIEITETVMMHTFESNKQKLEAIMSHGLSIHLDDFGSGYSSLNYLQNLPLDYVKVDKVFMDQLLQSDKQEKITKAIIKLAHDLGLKVIAEGVETKEQLGLLTLFKCDVVQGYYYSKPVTEAAILKLLKSHLDQDLHSF